MPTFEVEYASFRKVRYEAGSQEEADDMAAVMEDRDIEDKSRHEGYVIWNEAHKVN